MRSRSPLRASRKFMERYEVTYHCVGGVEFLTAKPRNSVKSIHLVYLHGGAYVIGRNGVGISEPLISSLIDGTGARLTFIDYPVAPESRFTDTLRGVYDVYLFLNRQYGDDFFVLVGDSAGGGLALSFAQMIKGDHNVVQPGRIVVFSPWLDLSLDNPGAQLERSDMILSRRALVYASMQYAGVKELRNPLVSPIYGDFSGLSRVLMFFGTRELFYADGLRMRGLAEENGWDVVLRFYPEMPHDWVLMPIMESRRAISEASGFILE